MNNMKDRVTKFLKRVNELDDQVEEIVGPDVVPWEDIVEIALNEFHIDSHNAAIEAVDSMLRYDATDDPTNYNDQTFCRAVHDSMRRDIKRLIIPIITNEPV